MLERYPVESARALVWAAKRGYIPGQSGKRILTWFYLHGPARAKTVLNRWWYDILGGSLLLLDELVDGLVNGAGRGWGRSLRRGVSYFLRRVPQAVKDRNIDMRIGEFTIRELAILSHMRGRGAW